MDRILEITPNKDFYPISNIRLVVPRATNCI